MNTPQFICPNCQSITAPDDVFCSHCGAKLNRSINVGLGKQIWIYCVCIFLPPLGLFWTWKYIRSDNPKLQRIGWITLVLTIIASILTIWVSVGFLQNLQNQLNSYSSIGL